MLLCGLITVWFNYCVVSFLVENFDFFPWLLPAESAWKGERLQFWVNPLKRENGKTENGKIQEKHLGTLLEKKKPPQIKHADLTPAVTYISDDWGNNWGNDFVGI